MAKKHLFISIGSSSTTALVLLLDRLSDLGIYKPLSNDYKDMFVGIDTDDGPLQKLESYNQGEYTHTYGIGFTKSANPNIPSHNFLQNSYRPDWNNNTLQILAAEQGVGGKRCKSYASLEWKEDLGKCMDLFFAGATEEDFLRDYQVILVTSSWGGTASGLYQNVADFISSKIYEKSGANFLTPFYTFLSLPNYTAAATARSSKGYQGIENFAYFMRAIQQTGWRGSLSKIQNMENVNLDFVFPEFCDLESSGKSINVQAPEKTERFCGTGSTLPQRAIVIVPTLNSATTSITVAEQLLLFSYLDILEQPLDAGNTIKATGKFVDIRSAWTANPTEDCPVLIGINMVECQFPREAVILRTIEKELHQTWKRFYTRNKSSDVNVPRFVDEFMKSQISIPAISQNNLNTVFNLLDENWTDNTERTVLLKNSIKDYIEKVENIAFDFPRFDDASDLLTKMAKYAEGLHDEVRSRAFHRSITLKDIRDGYTRQLDEWARIAKKFNQKKHIDKISNMIDYTITRSKSLYSGKSFNNFVVRYCNGQNQVLNEFQNIAREMIKGELLELQKQLLTKAIVKRWLLEDINKVPDNDNWRKVDVMFHNLSQENGEFPSSENNGFIKTVYNQNLEKSLSDLIKIGTEHCIKLMTCVAEEAELQSCYEKLRKDIKLHTLDEMSRRQIINIDNLDMITLRDSTLTGGGCCPNFRVSKATPSMFHFYAKCNGATDITWRDVENLGFKSFFNAKNQAINELTNVSVQHLSADIEHQGLGTWFEDNAMYNKGANEQDPQPAIPLHGMWLGSVDIGLTFMDVLPKVFTGEQCENIQNEAANLERNNGRQQQKQCCQTLFEKVVMGAFFGILNKKLSNIQLPVGKQLNIKFTAPDDEVIWEKTGMAKDLGVIGNQDGLKLVSVLDEQIKAFMSWMREENGSSKFAEKFDCKALFTNLLDQERFVLTAMRPCPTREQADLVIELYEKLKNHVSVAVI